MKNVDFNFEFVKGANINKVGAMIYKLELFADCITPKDKKHIRIKLRNTLDKFLGAYLQNAKNIENLAKIKKDWAKYAKSIYVDPTIIIDANGDKDKQNLCQKFIDAMQDKPKSNPKKETKPKEKTEPKKEIIAE